MKVHDFQISSKHFCSALATIGIDEVIDYERIKLLIKILNEGIKSVEDQERLDCA